MVTVIIPAYNYARFLPDAIESALAQAGPGLPIEVLVIDDGSTDDTPEVAARYGERIRYHRQENAGLSAARNTGLREARYELLVFLDADDLLAPGAVAALLEARERLEPKPAVLGGRIRRIDLEGGYLDPEPELDGSITPIAARLVVIRSRFPTTVLAERAVLLELGGFDTTLRACEDRDMWIRVAAHHPVARLERVVLLLRDHPGSMSKAAKRQSDNIRKVLEKAFANPALALTRRDRRLALAVWHHQTGLMLSAGGARLAPAGRFLRSLAAWSGPLPTETGVGRFSRLLAAAALLRRNLHKGALPSTYRQAKTNTSS